MNNGQKANLFFVLKAKRVLNLGSLAGRSFNRFRPFDFGQRFCRRFFPQHMWEKGTLTLSGCAQYLERFEIDTPFLIPIGSESFSESL